MRNFEFDAEIEETKTETKPKKRIVLKIFLILLLICFVLFLIARFISTSGLIVKEYAIIDNELPESFHGMKIVHLSDIHYTFPVDNKDLEKIVTQINEIKPEIVIFTGDLFTDYKLNEEEINELIKHLNNIEATLYKFAISGNHDYQYNNYEELIEKTDFIYLDNERYDIYFEGSNPISIYGLPSSLEDEPDHQVLNDDNNNYKIVLSHEPDEADKIVSYDPNIILSGHSHGGQVRIPFFGAIYTPVGSKKYYEEYYKINDTSLYVSSGIGNSVLPIRFLNKPSINVYRLYNN